MADKKRDGGITEETSAIFKNVLERLETLKQIISLRFSWVCEVED